MCVHLMEPQLHGRKADRLEDESMQLNQNNCKLQLPAFGNVYSNQAEDQKEINGVERTVNQADPIALQSPTRWWNAQGTPHERQATRPVQDI